MVGIVLASHGRFAEGLLDGAELLVGKQDQIETIGLYHGDSVDEFEAKIEAAMERVDTGDGVYAFVDIYGGTPSNCVMRIMGRKRFKAFAGVNMPMMINVMLSRLAIEEEAELYEAVSEVMEYKQILMHDKYAELMAGAEEDDEDEI